MQYILSDRQLRKQNVVLRYIADQLLVLAHILRPAVDLDRSRRRMRFAHQHVQESRLPSSRSTHNTPAAPSRHRSRYILQDLLPLPRLEAQSLKVKAKSNGIRLNCPTKRSDEALEVRRTGVIIIEHIVNGSIVVVRIPIQTTPVIRPPTHTPAVRGRWSAYRRIRPRDRHSR